MRSKYAVHTQATYAPRLVTSRHGHHGPCRSVAPKFLQHNGVMIRIYPESDGSLDQLAIVEAMAEVDALAT